MLTVARELQRLGHEIVIFVDEGEAELVHIEGITKSCGSASLPEQVDVLIVQDAIVAFTLAERYPETPMVFIAHSSVHDLQMPPQLDGLVDAAVAMNDRVMDRLGSLANPPKQLVRLTQPVAFDVFHHPVELPSEPRRLLSLGNRLTATRRRALQTACDELGIGFIEQGAQAGNESNPIAAIEGADIVVGYGRCIVEAMMAGKAAYVFDHQGGDGWITRDTYSRAESDGFVGRAGDPVQNGQLVDELRRYDPAMGLVNRDLALRNHDAAEHARRLVEIAESLVPSRRRMDHAGELARLTRLAWQWEAAAIQRRSVIDQREADWSTVDQCRAEIGQLTTELERETRRVAETTEELERLQEELATMREARRVLEASGSFRLSRSISRLAVPLRSLSRGRRFPRRPPRPPSEQAE